MGRLDNLRKRLAGDLVRSVGAVCSTARKGPREGIETWKDARDTLLSLGEFLSSKGGRHANIALVRMRHGSVGPHVFIRVDAGDRSFGVSMLEIDDGPDAQSTVIFSMEDGTSGGGDAFYRNDRGLALERIDPGRSPDAAHVLNLLRDLAEAAYGKGDVMTAGVALGNELVRMAETARQYEEILLKAWRTEKQEPECGDDPADPKPR